MKNLVILLLSIFGLMSASVANDSTLTINHQKEILENFVDSLTHQKTTMKNYYAYFGMNDELEFSLFKANCETSRISLDSCINLYHDRNTGELLVETSLVMEYLFSKYLKNYSHFNIRFVGGIHGSNLYELSIRNGQEMTYLYVRMANCIEMRDFIIEILTPSFSSVFLDYGN